MCRISSSNSAGSVYTRLWTLSARTRPARSLGVSRGVDVMTGLRVDTLYSSEMTPRAPSPRPRPDLRDAQDGRLRGRANPASGATRGREATGHNAVGFVAQSSCITRSVFMSQRFDARAQARCLVGALALALASSVSAADKVKVGFISTLSGPGAVIGIALRDGFNIALKETGGKLGGLPAELLIGDDQQTPDVGRQLAERMIKRDKVDFVTGVVFQNILSAVEQPVLSSGAFLISANSGPSYLAGEKCQPNFFAVSWISDSYAEATGKLARDSNYQRVFVIAANYPGGKDVVNGFRRF